MKPNESPIRCPWAGNELQAAYHDTEWGVPLYDEHRLFEHMTLSGVQAGLSWEIVLRKRERYREVFYQFQPEKIARFTPRRLEKLLADPGIIRNRLKLQAAVRNAQAIAVVRREFGSFSEFLWRLAGGVPRVNHWHSRGQVPARTAVSDAMSRELQRRGFSFVGGVICYAFMQSSGMVNDHLVGCFRHSACQTTRKAAAARARVSG